MMKTLQHPSIAMARNIVMTVVCLMLIVTVYSQNQPTFDPGQDPKPAGKRWEKIENMSDEFSGNSLNMSKWDNQDPQWRGRAPALFSVNAVSVGGGNLKIVADDNLTQQEQNQNPGYTYQGGLVRSRNKATYGYYETRMKANRTCLSSTFWLINKRNEFNGCDERVTELDITENIGINVFPNDPSRSWVDQNIVSINSNTHSRGVLGNPGCGIPVGSNGDKEPIGEPAYANYHVYGVWWKNANELIFFLDGQQVYNITSPADFDLGMYLRMVVESYDWNQPRPGFDNMNLPQADRTTYYDWTRSWRLVDDNGGGGSPQVNCNSLPSSLPRSNTIQVSVDYTSDQNRDVVIELWDTSTSPDSYLGHGTTTVGAGSGTANITINLGAAPAVGNTYQFKSSIRPVGANWQQNIDACQKNNISLTGGGGPPAVNCNSLPSSLPRSNTIQVSVDYTSDQNRDVVIELWDTSTSPDSYLGHGTTTVGAGSGTANITINLGAAPAVGNAYQFKSSIRPVGANWQQNIDACQKNNISLNNAGFAFRGENATSSDLPVLHDDIGVFPNPIRLGESFRMSLGDSKDEKHMMIYDMTGRMIYRSRTGDSEFRLNASNIFKTKGLYLVKLRGQNGKNEVFKLIVR